MDKLTVAEIPEMFEKVAEVFVAWDLEARYDKREILELYVNTAYFGEGCYGIAEASRVLLGKPASEMTPAVESATACMFCRV